MNDSLQPKGACVPGETEAALARFRGALVNVPDVADRFSHGHQFNAYELSGGSTFAVCIGPITSRPLSLVEAPEDVAELLTAALRLSTAVARPEALTGHARHLVDVAFPNGMRLTIVREDDYDAVTIWSEDGESIFTQAEVTTTASSVGTAKPCAQTTQGGEG